MLFLISRMFYFHSNNPNISVSHQPAPISRVLFSHSQRMESVLGNGARLHGNQAKQRSARVWRCCTFHETLTLSFHSSLYASIHVENVFIGVIWDKKTPCICCTFCKGSNLDLKYKLRVITKYAWSLCAALNFPPSSSVFLSRLMVFTVCTCTFIVSWYLHHLISAACSSSVEYRETEEES